MMVAIILIYIFLMALDIAAIVTLGPWTPLYPEIMYSGYLLFVVALAGGWFIWGFETLLFAERRTLLDKAWHSLLLLGIVGHFAICPIPPIVTMSVVSIYVTILFIIRQTIVRFAVIRCFKNEYPERKARLQQLVDLEAKKLHPEDAARLQ